MVQAADILGGFAGLISIFLFYLAVLNGCWPGVCSWRDGHQDMPLFGGKGRGASCVLWGWPPAPCGVGGGVFFLGGGGLWGVCVLWSWPPALCGVVFFWGGGSMGGLCVVELATCTMWGWGGGGRLWGVCVLWSWPPAPCGVGGGYGGSVCCGVGHLHHVGGGGVYGGSVCCGVGHLHHVVGWGGVYGGSVCCGVGHLHHVGLGEGMGWRRGAGLCGWGGVGGCRGVFWGWSPGPCGEGSSVGVGEGRGGQPPRLQMGTIGSVMVPFKTDWNYQWYNGTLSTQNGTIGCIMGLPQGLKSTIQVYLHFTLQGCRRLDEAIAVVAFQGDVSVALGEAQL